VGSDPRVSSSSQYLRTPVIRYSSRMRVGKLHRLNVTLAGNAEARTPTPATSGGFEPPLVVQVSVPGALVTPAHVILPLGGGEANFYIQPMAAGKLNGAKVEFLSQGRRVGEVPVRMKANHGRLAFWLFLLAIALPFLIHLLPRPSFLDTTPLGKPGREVVKPAPEVPGLSAPLDGSIRKAEPSKNETPPKTGGKQSSLMPEINDGISGVEFDLEEPSTLMIVPVMFQEKKETRPSPMLQRPRNPAAPAVGGPAQETGIRYEGEDAIWAWIKSLVVSAGYPVKLSSVTASGAGGVDILFDYLLYKRQYVIDGESEHDWDTKRLMAITLYYAEPVLCELYRFFFVFPANMPFGDLIYFFGFLALAALVWTATKPNRTRVRGPLMDIRVGG
jgi:hypothetical protein